MVCQTMCGCVLACASRTQSCGVSDHVWLCAGMCISHACRARAGEGTIESVLSGARPLAHVRACQGGSACVPGRTKGLRQERAECSGSSQVVQGDRPTGKRNFAKSQKDPKKEGIWQLCAMGKRPLYVSTSLYTTFFARKSPSPSATAKRMWSGWPTREAAT